MPIYERRCQRCRAEYKTLCNVADRNKPDTCPSCGCPDTARIVSPVRTTFRFADRKLKR